VLKLTVTLGTESIVGSNRAAYSQTEGLNFIRIGLYQITQYTVYIHGQNKGPVSRAAAMKAYT
jgi:hypothetical protein